MQNIFHAQVSLYTYFLSSLTFFSHAPYSGLSFYIHALCIYLTQSILSSDFFLLLLSLHIHANRVLHSIHNNLISMEFSHALSSLLVQHPFLRKSISSLCILVSILLLQTYIFLVYCSYNISFILWLTFSLFIMLRLHTFLLFFVTLFPPSFLTPSL